MNTMLAINSEWGYVILIVVGLILGTYLLVTVYSSIVEKTGVKDKNGCGWPLFLVAVFIVVALLLNMKGCDSNNSSTSNPDWQYRHTDRVK